MGLDKLGACLAEVSVIPVADTNKVAGAGCILPRRRTPGLRIASIARRPPNLQSDGRRHTITRKAGDEA
jgi:hypothetical protein